MIVSKKFGTNLKMHRKIKKLQYSSVNKDTWYYKKEELNIIAIISTIILY